MLFCLLLKLITCKPNNGLANTILSYVRYYYLLKLICGIDVLFVSVTSLSPQQYLWSCSASEGLFMSAVTLVWTQHCIEQIDRWAAYRLNIVHTVRCWSIEREVRFLSFKSLLMQIPITGSSFPFPTMQFCRYYAKVINRHVAF